MTAWPTVLVVRPRSQALAWAHELRAAGVPAATLPLIDIGPAPDPRRVAEVAAQALREAGAEPLLVFVSSNAVRGYFEHAATPWPATAWAGATGPGTVAALHAAGVPQARIVAPPDDSPQFDSEALWDAVAGWSWRDRPVWIVRGNGGREWLADRLREAGSRVDVVQSYERAAPVLAPDEQSTLAQALAEPARWLWLFSSSEAIDRLEELAPMHDWQEGRALATHPRIAERARTLGFGSVRLVRPGVAHVREAVQGPVAGYS